MYSTRISRVVRASAAHVYAALTNADAVARWRVPEGMTSRVHEFDPREGGRFRVSLTYVGEGSAGKSAEHIDTYHGHFARLVPGELVVEVFGFETDEAALAREMTMTTTITPVDEGVRVEILHEGCPAPVPRADNELGTRMALANLARLSSVSRSTWRMPTSTAVRPAGDRWADASCRGPASDFVVSSRSGTP